VRRKEREREINMAVSYLFNVSTLGDKNSLFNLA
jgi:hypothetical protein